MHLDGGGAEEARALNGAEVGARLKEATMNIPLLDPFESNQFPEVIEDILEDYGATICAFNRRGTLLAVGCTTGVVAVVDFVTRGIATYLPGHGRPLSSICWARNGRLLLTCSVDRLVILWDVESGMIVRKNEFDAAVTYAQLHPTNKDLAFACPMGEDPVLIDFTAVDGNAAEEGKAPEGKLQRLPLAAALAADATAAAAENTHKSKKKGVDAGNTTGAFSKDGSCVYVCDGSGNIVVFEAGIGREAVAKQTFHVNGGAGIRSIQFSRSGEHFVINSNDRVVRLFETVSGICMQEFRDVVNQLRWRKCTFSCDGDYIVGGSAEEAKHNLYIWNPLDGQLLKILEGPKEGLLDLVWHPLRPTIASVSTSGQVFIWSTHHTESWSAFAPDFKELEENEEYDEREDEFDEVDTAKVEENKVDDEAEDVDIMTIEKIGAFSSVSLSLVWCAPWLLVIMPMRGIPFCAKPGQ